MSEVCPAGFQSALPDAILLHAVRELVPSLPAALSSRIRLLPSRRPADRGSGPGGELSAAGDLCTGAAWIAAAGSGRRAQEIAAGLASGLGRRPEVDRAEVAGGGFVNLRLGQAALERVLDWRPDSLPEPVAMRIPLERLHRRDAGFTLQYAHARCRSLLRAGEAMGFAPAAEGLPPGLLGSAASRALLVRLDHWLRIGEAVGGSNKPPSIRLFLHDLSSCFDRWWQQGDDGATLRRLHPDEPERTRAHLALAATASRVIRAGLGALGEQAAEEVR